MKENALDNPATDSVLQRELMQSVAAGDRQAFEQLYRLTSPAFCGCVAHAASPRLGRRGLARQLYYRLESCGKLQPCTEFSHDLVDAHRAQSRH